MRARLIEGVHAVGQQVLKIYVRDFVVETKEDKSPLTEADMASHHALVALLEAETPGVPILSEESGGIPYETRRSWQRYWLIDPLDGTKEFIKKNGEFTLNVALIEEGVPVFGIVHAPALQTTWIGHVEHGAWKKEGEGPCYMIATRSLPDPEQDPWQIVSSRSHASLEVEAFCAGLPKYERIVVGSSLKFCLIAEGKADLYPRFGPTCEWDTAAAQAVVTAAGGAVLNIQTLKPLLYNQQESLLNPFFIACGEQELPWQVIRQHA
nr:3'(2'),5'-bisphosphate nucleotidase CysQ [Halomonas saliphila]